MPMESVPGTDLTYHLITFDADGRERTDDPQGIMSQVTRSTLHSELVSDLFLFCHGWMGDVPSAKLQYRNWIRAMAACQHDIRQMQTARTNFRPLLVGLHWPSRPWGDESLKASQVSFDVGAASQREDPVVENLIAPYAAAIADTAAARAALRTVVTAAQHGTGPDESTPELREAYRTLEREAALGQGGLDAAPGEDRPPFDPAVIVAEAAGEEDDEAVEFGLSPIRADDLLAPLRVLSFWKMKDRARRFGESGGHRLLAALSSAATRRAVRIHLTGHSFGCIVVSAMLTGPRNESQQIRPVDSLALIQGALSLWSYCSDLQGTTDRPGYFRRLIDSGAVAGPIITTQSSNDTAVGRFYPMGARLAGQVEFVPGRLPEYGGVGTWGLRGPGLDIVDLKMLPADRPYAFVPGKLYNLESSAYIAQMETFTGAHSDIAHPEVAHAVWQAALGDH
jgi:hypothetical protein